MESPEERLSGAGAEEDGRTVIPISPHGSAISRRSSNSQGSLRSSHSTPKSGLVKKSHSCRKYCNTVFACLIVGILISVGSVAMTVIGYFALNIASKTVETGNSTTVVLNEQLHVNLFKFRTFGPVMIGFGCFLIMCACVLLCEEKDKRNKSRNQASENLLSEHERIMQQARERFYNENRNAVMTESPQTVEYRTPKACANERTSCVDSEAEGPGGLTHVKPFADSTSEMENATGDSTSPVVLVHGPTIIEPTECTTRNAEVMDISPPNSVHSTPDHKSDNPSQHTKKSSPTYNDNTDGAENGILALPVSPVLPKIESHRGSNGVSPAGGAIPKSILVQPMKLSPIRSVNGPIRVRLDDSPIELSPMSPTSTSKSAECLRQPRSPSRLKRGKKKKSSGGSDTGSLGQCRCVSDPSMASVMSTDRQLDACCCLQPDCCWGGNCQLHKPLTSADQTTDDPLAGLVAPGVKTNLLQPLCTDTSVNSQSIELKPTNLEKLGDIETNSPNQDSTQEESHLKPQTKETQKRLEDQNSATDASNVTQEEPSSPSCQAGITSKYLPAGGDMDTTIGDTNSDVLLSKDRNSNITVSSTRQDATLGNSAPSGGQAQGGVKV